MSNILDIFNPPPPRAYTQAEIERDCLPCTAIQAAVLLGFGTYLLSLAVFKDNSGAIDPVKHPRWWQRSVRGAGILLVALGAYRAGEVGQMVWQRFE